MEMNMNDRRKAGGGMNTEKHGGAPAARGESLNRAGICAMMLAMIVLGCVWIVLSAFSFSRSVVNVGEYRRDMIEEFEIGAGNFMAHALGEIYTSEKTYMIPDSMIVMPEPDPDGYGRASAPEELVEVIERAEGYGLTDGDALFFPGADMELLGNSEIRYYLDETILTISWKCEIDRNVFNFTEVVVAHPSQFRKYITNNEFGSSVRKTVSQMSVELNPVVGMSADFYGYRDYGVMVYNGQLFRDDYYCLDSCYVDAGGELILVHKNRLSGDALKAFIAEKDINFSFSFGPILVEDHQLSPNSQDTEYHVGQPEGLFARAAIGQMGKLHYILCTVDGDVQSNRVYRTGVPVSKLAKVMLRTGCEKAYTLDGGQTASMTVGGELFNMVGYGSERPVSDMILFATALPSGGSEE